MLAETIIAIFAIVSVLYLWFRTDAFFEYTHAVFKLFKDYKLLKDTGGYSLFVHYLQEKIATTTGFPAFLLKIITCPDCFCFWLSLVASLLLHFIYLPVIYITALILFYSLCSLQDEANK